MISLNEEREIEQYQQALLDELQNILPQNKPKTSIEFEFNEDFWRLEKIMLAIKKYAKNTMANVTFT